jgi:hypothetical protein
MIFSVWTFKSVNDPFRMDYDQPVIIKFLWNERADARQIAEGLQAQFVKDVYQLATV